MKRILYIAICLLLISIVLGASGCDSLSPPSRTTSGSVISSQNTGIWVTGEGKVAVIPDVAICQLGVEAQEDSVAEAMTKASEAMGNVGLALADSNIESEDIQTGSFRVSQRTRWDDEERGEIVIGYRVTNMVTVKIRILAHESYTLDYKASTVIDTAVKAGGDLIRVEGLDFIVDDPAPYEKEAREKALADAYDKASQIADTAGVRLGEPTYIAESVSLPRSYGGGMVFAIPESASALPPISAGETEIAIIVQVAYNIN